VKRRGARKLDRGASATAPAAAKEAQPVAPAMGLLLFAPATFISAFLLFQVQPLISRYILPWFGGSAGVWTVSVLFFQVFLLIGYAYSHLLIRRLRPRTQAAVHAAVALAAAAMLPIIPAERWKPAGDEDPTLQILLLLTMTLGAPYLLVSATAPLLQAWFSRLNAGRSPYRLYALSNLASLLALLSYPFLVEPALTREAQAWAWSAGLLAFVVLLLGCAVLLWRQGEDEGEVAAATAGIELHAEWSRIVMWLLLPACASLLMLAFTNRISHEVAVVPFLWVLPLAVYLLSFIICFDSPRWYVRTVWGWALAAALLAVVLVMLNPQLHILMQIAIYVTGLFICCMVCHGELVRLRPDPRQLTAFYLMVAAGGAMGGLIVGVAGPLLLEGFYELHGGLLATPVLLLAAMYMDERSRLHRGRSRLGWYGSIAGIVMLSMLLWMDAGQRPEETAVIERRRNFYGVLSVYEMRKMPVRMLYHGGVMHGIQWTDPRRRHEPTAYYGPGSGVGLALRQLIDENAPSRHIGAVGLGVGTIVTYGRPQDQFRFYEIDMEVDRLAREFFTYMDDAVSAVEVVSGDARLSMEREPEQRYDILVVDAFSGDAIPVHLLTVEAMQLYLRHVREDGIIAIHISNQHLDLEGVVARVAETAGVSGVMVRHDPPDDAPLEYRSEWAVISRDAARLDADPIGAAARPLRDLRGVRPWTDGYSSLFQVLR
jgi:hypothetical protein